MGTVCCGKACASISTGSTNRAKQSEIAPWFSEVQCFLGLAQGRILLAGHSVPICSVTSRAAQAARPVPILPTRVHTEGPQELKTVRRPGSGHCPRHLALHSEGARNNTVLNSLLNCSLIAIKNINLLNNTLILPPDWHSTGL
jgi:hypothetical protein